MLDNPTRWRRLVHEYSALKQLQNGMTPQARGQRFNGLIAELFTVFGIVAKANQSSVGEIDVTFSHAGRRFILEAKWEKKTTATDSIAKLQRRAEQRMAGVTGVFLSMQGYSGDAVAEVDKGRRLDMVLLDQEHWEAMLSGFVPPPELLDLVIDSASFTGQAYTPLGALLDPKIVVPEVTFASSRQPRDVLFRSLADHVRAKAVVTDIASRQLGVASNGEGGLLVTTEHGVLSVNPATRTTGWAARVIGCRDSRLSVDGSILLLRAHGVGLHGAGVLKAVSSGGAADSNCQLLLHPDNSAWCFDPGVDSRDRRGPATLIKLGTSVGEEREHDVPYLSGIATGAAWLNTTDVVLTGDPDIVTWPVSGSRKNLLTLPKSYPTTAVAVDDRRVVLLAADLTLWVTDVRAEQHFVLGQLDGDDLVACRLSGGFMDSVYLATRHSSRSGEDRMNIMHVTVAGPWLPSVRTLKAMSTSPARKEKDVLMAPPAEPASVDSKTGSPPVEPVSQPVIAAPPTSAAQAAAARRADQRKGYRDGTSLAATLPLYALETAARMNFDVRHWLEPWRREWEVIVTGKASPNSVLVDWLPVAAQMLGSYAAPADVLESHFDPTPSYVIGFSNGMRAAWDSAMQSGILPQDENVLSEWLRQPVSLGSSVTGQVPRGLTTLKDLRTVATRVRRKSIRARMGRLVLWLATGFFGIGTIVAVVATIVNEWPGHDGVNAIIGNLFYEVPFVVLMVFVVRDVRKIKRLKRGVNSDGRGQGV